MLNRNFIKHKVFKYIQNQIFKVSFDRQSFCTSVSFVFFRSVFCICHGFTTIGKYRSSPREGFLEKGSLKACSKVTGEHPCRSLISIKLQSIFIEITLRCWCSFVNLLHIFRSPFHEKISAGLFLKISICLAFNELRNLKVNKTKALIHFMSPLSSHTPWKHQKTRSCLMFSGGVEKEQWQ